MVRHSASALERLEACPGSGALPQVQFKSSYSDKGTAVHRFLARVPEVGRDAALAEVAEAYRAACEALDLSALPACSPESYAAEVAFAFDIVLGTARELGRGLSREEAYAQAAGLEVVGTADVVGLTEDAVVVLDYKSGFRRLTPPKQNLQLGFYALAAARAYGKRRAIVSLVHVPEGMDSWHETAELSEEELNALHPRLRAIVDGVLFEQAVVAGGEIPTLVEGPHCQYCPAFTVCPAKVTLARAMGQPAAELDLVPAITLEGAAKAWARICAIEEVLKQVRAVLKDMAKEAPIPLDAGYVLGPVQEERIRAEVAAKVLEERYSPEVARAALEQEPKITKASLQRALKAHALKPGMRISHVMAACMAELREAGAVTTVTCIERHKPKALPEGQA